MEDFLIIGVPAGKSTTGGPCGRRGPVALRPDGSTDVRDRLNRNGLRRPIRSRPQDDASDQVTPAAPGSQTTP
jgi:hypothetical protein